jgi:glutathione-independent formaldehyde dehydrogenase
MVRGRTTAPKGLILGHEITGEVIEAGPGVEFIKEGDLCSSPSTSPAAAAACARRVTLACV